ncbi:MAG: hypothetical protein ACM3WU_11960 [Bacillota bacterium]
MKKWVSAILQELDTPITGIPTFCEDPDDLLELADIREAIRSVGMSVQDLDLENIRLLKEIPDGEKPIFPVIDPVATRALVDSRLCDYRWVSIGISDVFPRFSTKVIRGIPISLWEELFSLHSRVPDNLDSQETAILISRSLYGIDPIYLRHADGVMGLLSRLAISNEGLPREIAQILCSYLERIILVPEVLTDPSSARAALLRTADDWPAACSEPVRILIREATKLGRRESLREEPLSGYLGPEASEVDCARYGLEYCRILLRGRLSGTDHLEANKAFQAWLIRNYALILSSSSQEVLRIAGVLDRVDWDVGDSKAVIFMMDGLGLPAWLAVQEDLEAKGIVSQCIVKIGFAAIPTTTWFSRRLFFEGRVPSDYRVERHTERLERLAWSRRYGDSSACVTSKEESAVLESFALARRRVCIVDTTWDEYCHGVNPETETFREACSRWPGKPRFEMMISEAFKHGYRVFITADHGEALCEGTGRIHVGELAEKGSKRVRIFENDAVCRRFVSDRAYSFRPPGFPPDRWPLFAQDFGSFDEMGSKSYCHGGLSIEEVLIPVAEVFHS